MPPTTPAGRFALVATFAMAAPVWWACLVAAHHGWWPDRDDAQIGMRVLDLLRGHLQFTGARSTTALVSPSLSSHHPGPIEFYLLAPFVALAGGHPVGLLLGMAAIHTAAISGIARASWVLGRGRLVAAMAFATLVLEVGGGDGNLFRPLNTSPPTFFLLLVPLSAVLAVRGHSSWMWVLAVSATVVVQGQLAFVPCVAVVTLAVCIIGLSDWRRRRGTFWPLPGWTPVRSSRWRPGWLTTALLVLMWGLPAWESMTGDPGNLTQLWGYLTADKPTDAMATGGPGRFVLHYLSWPIPFHGLPDVLKSALVVALMVAVVQLVRIRDRQEISDPAMRGWRHGWRSSRWLLAAYAVACVPLEVASLYVLLPTSTTFGAPPAYWLTPLIAASAFLWAVLLWLTAETLMPRLRRRWSDQPLQRTATVSVALALVIGAVWVTQADRTYNMAENEVLTESGAIALDGVRRLVPPGSPVLVTSGGANVFLNPVAGITYRLMDAGVFACANLPWPGPEDTDYRGPAACPEGSPVVVAMTWGSTTRPSLAGSWQLIGRTHGYRSADGSKRGFDLFLVTAPEQ